MPAPTYSATTPLYVQVADDLREKITAGDYQPGGKLPSNRELSDHYEVADGTIRAALEELRGEGTVETRSTLGTFVTGKPSAPASRLDLRTAGERIAELTREVRELRSRMGRMEAAIATLSKRSGQPNPLGGERDAPEKAPRRGRAGR